MQLSVVVAIVFISHFPPDGTSVSICETYEKRIVHRFYPLRHCQRSNRTVIGLINVKSLRECADFARDKQALAFNYAPEGRNTSNLFDVIKEQERNRTNQTPWKPQLPAVSNPFGFDDFYNCHVLDCPEYKNLSTIVNDTRFDYYTLYARNLPSSNATCIPSIGMFLFEDMKMNYSNAYNSCTTAGGSLAHVASDSRTFHLARYISNLPRLNDSSSNTSISMDDPLYYVGLNDTVKDKFYTSAEEQLDCFTFRSWAPGHPDHNRQTPSCVALTDEGSWKVFRCNRALPYICELHTSGPAIYRPKLNRTCFVKRPNNRIAPSRQLTTK